MVIFGILMALLLHLFGIRFFDAPFFAIIGFSAHLFEDAILYDPGYGFLWPFSSKIPGLGFLPNMINEENNMRNFFGIANTEVLIIGMVFLLVVIIIRTYIEGSTWIRWYMPDRCRSPCSTGKKPAISGTGPVQKKALKIPYPVYYQISNRNVIYVLRCDLSPD
jgi:hypothetical protein